MCVKPGSVESLMMGSNNRVWLLVRMKPDSPWQIPNETTESVWFSTAPVYLVGRLFQLYWGDYRMAKCKYQQLSVWIPRVSVCSPSSDTHSTIVLGVTGWLLGRKFRFHIALGKASSDIRMDSWLKDSTELLFRLWSCETDILLWVSHSHGILVWSRTKYARTGNCSADSAVP